MRLIISLVPRLSPHKRYNSCVTFDCTCTGYNIIIARVGADEANE